MALLHSWLLPSFCAAVLTHPAWNWRFCWGRLAYLITTRFPALAQCAQQSWGLSLIALWGFSSYLIIGVNCANSFIGNTRTNQCFFYARGTGLQSLASFDERSDCALIISCRVCGQHLSHMFLNARGRDTLTLPRKSQMSRSLPDLEGMVFLLACPAPTPPPPPPPIHPPPPPPPEVLEIHRWSVQVYTDQCAKRNKTRKKLGFGSTSENNEMSVCVCVYARARVCVCMHALPLIKRPFTFTK